LVLEEASQHITLLVHAMGALLLLLVDSPLVSLDLLPLEVVSLHFAFSFADCGFVFVDILQFLLVFHEVVVVLLVDRVLLGLYLAADHHFLVVLLLLSLLLLLLSCSHLLAQGQFFEGGLFLFFHDLFLSQVVLLHRSSVIFVHLSFLLDRSPPLLLGLPPLLIDDLQVL
jgi:hypothetical protein